MKTKPARYTYPYCSCQQDLPPRPPIGTRVRHYERGNGVIFSYDNCDETACGVDYGKRGQWCEAIRELAIFTMTKKPAKAKAPRKVMDRARKKISRTIAMRPSEWDKLDAMRGKTARGAIIAKKMKLTE